MPKSVFTDAYALVVDALIALRRDRQVSQVELAQRLGKSQQWVSLVERRERRVDVVEFYAIASALGADPVKVFEEIAGRLPTSPQI